MTFASYLKFNFTAHVFQQMFDIVGVLTHVIVHYSTGKIA